MHGNKHGGWRAENIEVPGAAHLPLEREKGRDYAEKAPFRLLERDGALVFLLARRACCERGP